MSKQYLEQWPIRSFTTDEQYKVSLDLEGVYSCSCKAWIFQRKHLHQGEMRKDMEEEDCDHSCKHIMFVLHERHTIDTAVANKSSMRIGDQLKGLYIEVAEGRIVSFFENLGIPTKRR